MVSTSPLRIPRTNKRSFWMATTLYCSSKIDISVSFIWTIGCAMSYQQFFRVELGDFVLKEPVISTG